MQQASRPSAGLTLLELIVVLTILVALGSIVVPMFGGLGEDCRRQATLESLRQLQDVILNRYVLDMGMLPAPDAAHLQPSSRIVSPQLQFLFVNPQSNDSQSSFNPITTRGWRGPYLNSGRGGTYPGYDPSTATAHGFTNQYGETGDQAVLDGWGNPVVIKPGVDIAHSQLISAGPDGSLNTSDDLVMWLR